MKLNKLFKTVIMMIAVFFMALSSSATKIEAGTILNTERTEYTYRSTSGITGEIKEQNVYKMNMQGVYAFCVESGIPTSFGTEYVSEEYISQHKEVLSKIAYYGYTKTAKTDYDYAVTQMMIWEHLGDVIHYTNIPNFQERKTEIMNLVNNHNVVPSWNDSTIELDENSSQIVVDSNKILSKMTITSNTTNSEVSIVGNELRINTTSESEAGAITFSKLDESEIGTSIIYKKPETQSLVEFHLESNVTASINLKLNYYNDFSIQKLNETYSIVDGNYEYEMNGVASNVIFTLENVNGEVFRTVETDENGILNFSKIPLGIFYLKETQSTSNDYILSEEVLRVESTRNDLKVFNNVSNEQLQSVSENEYVYEFYNYLKKGTLEITKYAIDTKEVLANATIGIYDNDMNLITSSVTGEDGKVIFENIPKGTYYVLEILSPDGYYLDETITELVILEDGDIIYHTISNKMIEVPESLPKTGIETTRIILIMGSVLFLLVAFRKFVLKTK